MTEGEVVPAGVADLVGEDRPGPFRPLPFLVEEAVSQGEAPSPSVHFRDVVERTERGRVLLHRAAPHEDVEFRDVDGLAVQSRIT